MQKVIRSYVFDGKSLDKLQETLDEGYVVVANKRLENVMMVMNIFLKIKIKIKEVSLMLLLKD